MWILDKNCSQGRTATFNLPNNGMMIVRQMFCRRMPIKAQLIEKATSLSASEQRFLLLPAKIAPDFQS